MMLRFVLVLRHLWSALFHRVPKRQRSFPGIRYVSSMAETERPIQKGKLVVVGTLLAPKWLLFVCPCGCGERIALNLMKSHSPKWTIAESADGKLCVSPSIDSTTCRSHYWIRRNRIDWV